MVKARAIVCNNYCRRAHRDGVGVRIAPSSPLIHCSQSLSNILRMCLNRCCQILRAHTDSIRVNGALTVNAILTY
jgi:hypothetical protein